MVRLVSVWTFRSDSVEHISFQTINVVYVIALCVFQSFHEILLFSRNDLLVACDLVLFKLFRYDLLIIRNLLINDVSFDQILFVDFKRLFNWFNFLFDSQCLSWKIMIFKRNRFLVCKSLSISINRTLFLLNFLSQILNLHYKIELIELTHIFNSN